MGKTKVLDKHIAELIAAGEVVERPWSTLEPSVQNTSQIICIAKIKVLDKHPAKSIAASEVVERPGSTLGKL